MVSREALEKTIWPEQEPNKAMLKMLLFRLRNLIDGDNDQALIHTARGIGISLKVEDNG